MDRLRVGQERQVDDRVLHHQGLPYHQADEADHGQDGERADEGGGEPVGLLALVQHHLQAAEGQHHEGEAHVVDPDAAPARARAGDGLGILDQALGEHQRQQARPGCS